MSKSDAPLWMHVLAILIVAALVVSAVTISVVACKARYDAPTWACVVRALE